MRDRFNGPSVHFCLGFKFRGDAPHVETSHGLLIPTAGIQGSHVRLHANGGSRDAMNRYTEVVTYGRPLRR